MRVLVIGGGGREHAIVRSLVSSPRVERVIAAPGNAGIARLAKVVDIAATDTEALVELARREGCELAVIGPEDALAAGVVDALSAAGCRAFGPSRSAARLESSKAWSKELMAEFGIPMPSYARFDSADAAEKHCRAIGACVVKADGLARGKGAIVCRSAAEAVDAVRALMREQTFGDAGSSVVIEELLTGEEFSFMFFTDGTAIAATPIAQDHKPVGDGDVGPNTGGMGAYTPVPRADQALHDACMERVARPVLAGLRARGEDYRGVVCGNLMITDAGPQVLEFNARFGDPEAEVVLPLLETDLCDVVEHCLDGTLADLELRWSSQAAVTVAVAAKGYPAAARAGDVIEGLDAETPETIVFHAGTATVDGRIVTAGGRVLMVTAVGDNVRAARDAAYRRVAALAFDDMHYRSDIGWRAVTDSAA